MPVTGMSLKYEDGTYRDCKQGAPEEASVKKDEIKTYYKTYYAKRYRLKPTEAQIAG